MKTLWSLSTRVAAQAFLALSSYLVSISAAHSLETEALAVFFVGWTLESMWIGAIRMIIVPALLLHESAPRPLVLVAAGSLLGLPLTVAVLITGAGLTFLTQWLLALSVLTLGAYEIARSMLSRGIASAAALPLADAVVFVIALVGVMSGGVLKLDGLTTALGSLSAAALIVSAGIVLVLRSSQRGAVRPEPLRSWMRATWPLLRLGGLEWIVFFVSSTAGLALLGFLGGPRVLAGVRLAETLVAPIGLVSSALPYVVASALRADKVAHGAWPRAVRHVWLLLTIGTVAYLVAIQLAPESLLSILVGEHVGIAREASLGLAIGVIASVFAATATLVMKHRRQVKVLSRLRTIELAVTLPAVAAGASTGSLVGAGLGISSSQLFPAVVQGVVQFRTSRGGGRRVADGDSKANDDSGR
jgi:hypothetical protein